MNEETRHTPGPWWRRERRTRHHELSRIDVMWSEGGAVDREAARRRISIAEVLPHHDDEVTIANAHLIAAAPELLAACEALLSAIYDLSDDDRKKFYENDRDFYTSTLNAEAAIANAKGGGS